MDINLDKIARLSKLSIEPERRDMFLSQMQSIIAMAGELPEYESGGSFINENEPMVLRSDEVAPSLPRAEILKNAPRSQAGCVVVPKTVGE